MNANNNPSLPSNLSRISADAYDACVIAEENLDWLNTLVDVARKELLNDNPAVAKTLLDIASYLATEQQGYFAEQAKIFEHQL